jgi:ferric-dicitrate binding protein FerR (iron transport regulator)
MDNFSNSSRDHFWSLLSKKLAHESTAEELLEFESLLLQNTDLQVQVEMLSYMLNQRPEEVSSWNEAAYMRHLMDYKEDFFPKDPTEETSFLPASETAGNNSRLRKFFLNKITLAIAGILIIFASWKIYFQKKNPAEKIIANNISSVTTKNGNRTKITLPDGSQVWLNGGSKLDYNPELFNEERREVYLSGEAFFEVVKNLKKPFLVHADNMQVKVLGTSFNIKSYPGEKQSEASLIRGSIEVTIPGRPQEKYFLSPNDKFVVSNTGSIIQKSRTKAAGIEKSELKKPEAIFSMEKINYLPEKNIILETAWVYNRLEFDSEPFGDIAKKMERWYDVNISFTGHKIENKILTGSFENETIEQALEALKIVVSFNYRIDGKKIIIKP